jgi:Flp pilus assembly protein TadB
MGFREDIKGVPDDVRTAVRDADESLERVAKERPVVSYALDLRIVLASVAGAFVIALILRLLGLSYLISLIVFLLLLVGLWMVLAGAAAPRRPTARARVREGAQPGGGARERDAIG